MPLWFKLALGFCLVALIIVIGGILFTETLVDVVDYQMLALRNHEVDKAYYDYTSKAFRDSTSLEQFHAFVDAHPLITNSAISKLTRRSIEDHMGILRGELVTTENEKVPIEFKIVREDGTWKIYSIRLLHTHRYGQVKPPEEKQEHEDTTHAAGVIGSILVSP